MANKAGDKRADKAARRKKRLTRRTARQSLRSAAHHYDVLFGQLVRFGTYHLQQTDSLDRDVVDYVARGRLRDGRRVLRAFLDEAKLGDQDTAVVRGWTGVFASLYEPLQVRDTTLLLRDLVTWREHKVALAHPAAAQALERSRFVGGVLLPVHDGWVVGGELVGARPDASRAEALRVASNLARERPRPLQLAHPEALAGLLDLAYEAFVAAHGAPYVLVSRDQAEEALLAALAELGDAEVDGLAPSLLLSISRSHPELGLIADRRWGYQAVPDLRTLLDAVVDGDVDAVRAWLGREDPCPAALSAVHHSAPDALTDVLCQLMGREVRWPADHDAVVAALLPSHRRVRPTIAPFPVELLRHSEDVPTSTMAQLLGLEAP